MGKKRNLFLVAITTLFLVMSISCASNNNQNEPDTPIEPDTPTDPIEKLDIDEAVYELPLDGNISHSLIQYGSSSFGDLIEPLSKNILTSKEINSISNYEEAKKAISTVADAMEYFKTLTYENYWYWNFKNPVCNNNIVYSTTHRVDKSEMAKSSVEQKQFSLNVAQVFISYFLENDYPDSGTIYAFEKMDNFDDGPRYGSYFLINGIYHVLFYYNERCFNDCSKAYSNLEFDYFKTDNLLNLGNAYKGRYGSGIFALIKDTCCPETNIKISNKTFRVTGTGKSIYIDKNYVEEIQPYDYDTISDFKIPSELGELSFVDKTQAKELRYVSPDELKKNIKTLRDLVYYMVLNGYYCGNGDLQFFDNSGKTYWHYNRAGEKVFRDLYYDCGGGSNLAKFVLSDDYEEVGFVGYTFLEGKGGGHVTNYIKQNGKYYFFDLTTLSGDGNPSDSFTVDVCDSFEDFSSLAIKDYNYTNLMYVYKEYKDGYDMPVCWDDGTKITYVPSGAEYKIIYSKDNYTIKEKLMDMDLNRYGVPIIIKSSIPYNLSSKSNITELGEAKLSIIELQDLCDESIDIIKNKISTLSDLLNFMYIRGMQNFENDLYSIVENCSWKFNRSAKTVLRSNGGDCGGLANFTHYILDGDYEENGFINYTFKVGEGGGHVTNYVKHNDKYYFFDMTGWHGGNYSTSWFECLKYNSFEEFIGKAEYYWHSVAYNVCSYVDEYDLPVNWYRLDEGLTYYPDKYKINILLEKEDYKFVPYSLSSKGVEYINALRN